MNYSILKLLLRQAIHDIREHVPRGYFDLRPSKFPLKKPYIEGFLIGLMPDSSKEKIRAVRASMLGDIILKMNYLVTARQYAACEMLRPLGELIAIESNKIKGLTEREIELEPLLKIFIRPESTASQIPEVTNNLRVLLERYLNYLPQQEARTFLSLVDEQEQPKPQIKRIYLQPQQEEEILRIIREVLKLDPENLPPPKKRGKAGLRQAVHKKVTIPSELFRSDTVFYKAWDRARKYFTYASQ